MATTSPDNLYSPDNGTNYDIPVATAAMQDSVQTALNSLRTQVPNLSSYRVGTNAQRLAIPSGSLFPGLLFWTTDTQTWWQYRATAWVNISPANAVAPYATAGAHSVNPTAIVFRSGVTSGTTSPTGTLAHTFSTAFPTACIGVWFMPNQTQGASNPVEILGGPSGVSATGFSTFWPGQASVSRALPYVAMGY